MYFLTLDKMYKFFRVKENPKIYIVVLDWMMDLVIRD